MADDLFRAVGLLGGSQLCQLLLDRFGFRLQIPQVVFQPGDTLLARVEATPKLAARLALAAAVMTVLMVVSGPATTSVLMLAAAVVPSVPSLAALVAVSLVAFAVTTAVTATPTLALVAVAVMAMMMSVLFMGAHRYLLLFFGGDGARVATSDSYSARN